MIVTIVSCESKVAVFRDIAIGHRKTDRLGIDGKALRLGTRKFVVGVGEAIRRGGVIARVRLSARDGDATGIARDHVAHAARGHLRRAVIGQTRICPVQNRFELVDRPSVRSSRRDLVIGADVGICRKADGISAGVGGGIKLIVGICRRSVACRRDGESVGGQAGARRRKGYGPIRGIGGIDDVGNAHRHAVPAAIVRRCVFGQSVRHPCNGDRAPGDGPGYGKRRAENVVGISRRIHRKSNSMRPDVHSRIHFGSA